MGAIGAVKTHYRLILLLSGAFLMGVAAGNSVTLQESLAQGYTGLIAGGSKEKGKKEQPLGYKGLIPGYVAPQKDAPAGQQQRQGTNKGKTPATAAGQAATPPTASWRQNQGNMTAVPGRTSPRTIRTIDDIKTRSAAAAKDVRWDEAKLPPQIDAMLNKSLTPQDKAILSTPRYRLKGMLPREYAAQTKIDSIMSFVNDPALSDKERQINARKAREKLVQYAQYLDIKSQVPDSLYQKMGLPDVYVQETREGVQKSLARVENALKELRKYQ